MLRRAKSWMGRKKITGDSRERAAVVKEMLLDNFGLCERAGVFSPDNLAKMKQGHAVLSK